MKRLIPLSVIFFAVLVFCLQASAQIPTPAGSQKDGLRYALCVGIGHYESKSLAAEINFARDDAKSVARAFAGKSAFDKVLLMTDDLDKGASDYPSKANIVKRVSSLVALANPDDAVVIFFSGYGISDSSERSFLLPADAKADEKGTLAIESAIDIADLARPFADKGVKKTALLVDASRASFPSGEKSPAFFAVKPGTNAFAEVLSSADAETRSYDDPKAKIGVFTRFLIEGLSGEADENRDGKVSMGELSFYVEEGVRAFAAENGKDQVPQSIANDTTLAQVPMGFGSPSKEKVAPSAIADAAPSATPIPMPEGMVLVPGGIFKMGSPESDGLRTKGETLHGVSVSAFFMSKYELTRGEFSEFVNATNFVTEAEKEKGGFCFINGVWLFKKGASWKDPNFGQSDMDPVVEVSWMDAIEYCNWRSLKEGLSPCYTSENSIVSCDWKANGYRLPTEAEWEYACRAGGTAATSFGNSLSSYQANFNGTMPLNGGKLGPYIGETMPVGSFEPNAFGIYDMHGNAWERCWDYLGNYPQASQYDPKGPNKGTYRVLRGGAWDSAGSELRSARHNEVVPNHGNDIGFRLVRNAPKSGGD